MLMVGGTTLTARRLTVGARRDTEWAFPDIGKRSQRDPESGA